MLVVSSNLRRQSIESADWRPGVGAQAGDEFLKAEPGAGLICAHLEGHAFAEDVDWKLEVAR